MADTKISALPAVVTVQDADEFAVNQSLVSKKVTVSQLKSDQSRFVASYQASGLTDTISDTVLLSSATAGLYRASVVITADDLVTAGFFFIVDTSILHSGLTYANFQCAVAMWDTVLGWVKIPTFDSSQAFAHGHSFFHHSGGDISISQGGPGGVGGTGKLFSIDAVLERIPVV